MEFIITMLTVWDNNAWIINPKKIWNIPTFLEICVFRFSMWVIDTYFIRIVYVAWYLNI